MMIHFEKLLLTMALILPASFSLECKDHPAIQDLTDFNGVLLKDFTYPRRSGANLRYIPRFDEVDFDLLDSEQGLLGLDLVVVGNHKCTGEDCSSEDKPITMRFTRTASVFMLVDSPEILFEHASEHPGIGEPGEDWEFLGRFQSDPGNSPQISYGIHEEKINLPDFGYAYKLKHDTTSVALPRIDHVYDRTQLVDEKSRGTYVVMVGEAGGLPSSLPDLPTTMTNPMVPIKPLERCPQELHEHWELAGVTEDSTLEDEDRFDTWHPVYDPCYWCLYDHEHGSDASKLIGPEYAPRYTYAALKNNNEEESNEGFKSFVFEYGDYMVNYDVHMKNSDARRFKVALHTAIYTVVRKDTNELMVRLTQKVNYGSLKFLDQKGKQQSLGPTESSNGRMPRKRVMNGPKSNRYEKWLGFFMCSNHENGSKRMLSIKITNTPTRIKDVNVGIDNLEAVPIIKKGQQQRGIERKSCWNLILGYRSTSQS